MARKIIIDSGCDIPKNLREESSLDVLPIIVTDDEKDYRDGIDILPEEIYRRMRLGENFKTAQISPTIFFQKFMEYVEDYDEILYIGFSSGLSGTFNNARLARDMVIDQGYSGRIDLIDTKGATLGGGLIISEVLEMDKKGLRMDEIIEETNYLISKLVHLFSVDNIDYLYRGGRVSKVEALAGGVLNIKPILHMNTETGKLEVINKARGKNNLYKTILKVLKEKSNGYKFRNNKIGIVHGDCLGEAEKLLLKINEESHLKDVDIEIVGSTIGAHVGPGLLGIVFISE